MQPPLNRSHNIRYNFNAGCSAGSAPFFVIRRITSYLFVLVENRSGGESVTTRLWCSRCVGEKTFEVNDAKLYGGSSLTVAALQDMWLSGVCGHAAPRC